MKINVTRLFQSPPPVESIAMEMDDNIYEVFQKIRQTRLVSEPFYLFGRFLIPPLNAVQVFQHLASASASATPQNKIPLHTWSAFLANMANAGEPEFAADVSLFDVANWLNADPLEETLVYWPIGFRDLPWTFVANPTNSASESNEAIGDMNKDFRQRLFEVSPPFCTAGAELFDLFVCSQGDLAHPDKWILDKAPPSQRLPDLSILNSNHDNYSFVPKTSGFRFLSLTIHPDYNSRIPLDILFRVIHATESYPFVRHNLKTNESGSIYQESIYRLYAPTALPDGTKVPLLKKTPFTSIRQQTGKTKLVSIFHAQTGILTEFLEDGKVRIVYSGIRTLNVLGRFTSETSHPLVPFHQMDDYIASAVNATLDWVRSLLVTSGLSIPAFKGIHQNNVTLEQANVDYTFPIKYPFTFTNTQEWNHLFMETIGPETGIYRRTSVEEGFPMSNMKNNFTGTTTLSVSNVNHLGYLNFISRYLTELVALSQQRHGELAGFMVAATAEEQKDDDDGDEEEQDDDVEGEIEIFEAKPEEPEAEEAIELIEFGGGAGAKKTKHVQEVFPAQGKDIDNMPIKHQADPFAKKFKERMPILFQGKNDGKDTYIRKCPFSKNKRSRPIILNDEEKAQLMAEHPGEMQEEDFLSYMNYHFACPRYWCLLGTPEHPDGRVITKDEIMAGKCSKDGLPIQSLDQAVLSNGAKTVSDGKYVIQINTAKGAKAIPGFQKKRINGACVPCCFEEKLKAKLLSSKAECFNQTNLENNNNNKDTSYIKGPEKFGQALEPLRWAWLPEPVDQLLEQDSPTQLKTIEAVERKGLFVLLRRGVEFSANQSFLVAIGQALQTNKTAKAMGEHLAQSLTVDKFVSLQNGDLISQFFGRDPTAPLSPVHSYASKVIQQLQLEEENGVELVQRILQSFENFKAFLRDPESHIDFTYIWDLVCTPSKKLFPTGINLILLEIHDQQVHIVCPPNHYTASFFYPNRPSLLLVKHAWEWEGSSCYEPVYAVMGEEEPVCLLTPELNPMVSRFLNQVAKPAFKQCAPHHDMVFQAPPLLSDLWKQLKQTYGETALTQVMGEQGKVVGVFVENHGFVPCHPSAVHTPFPFQSFASVPWLPFEPTLNFLQTQYGPEQKLFMVASPLTESNPTEFLTKGSNMPSIFLITGFYTPTHQFVPIRPPALSTDVNVRNGTDILWEDSPMEVNQQTVGTFSQDEERADFMARIQTETRMYNSFRSTVRMQINRIENGDRKERLEALCGEHGKHGIYREQLQQVVQLLQEIVGPEAVVFAQVENFRLLGIVNESGHVIVSEQNLMNPQRSNKELYFTKMADELMRFNRISPFVFKPRQYLAYSETPLQLNSDEIVVFQNMINFLYESLHKKTTAKDPQYNVFVKTRDYTNPNPAEKETVMMEPEAQETRTDFFQVQEAAEEAEDEDLLLEEPEEANIGAEEGEVEPDKEEEVNEIPSEHLFDQAPSIPVPLTEPSIPLAEPSVPVPLAEPSMPLVEPSVPVPLAEPSVPLAEPSVPAMSNKPASEDDGIIEIIENPKKRKTNVPSNIRPAKRPKHGNVLQTQPVNPSDIMVIDLTEGSS